MEGRPTPGLLPHLRAGIFSLHGTQGLAVVPCLALGLNALSLIFSLLQLDLCPTQRNVIMSKCADVHEASRAKQKVCSHYLLVETELEEMFRKLISPITQRRRKPKPQSIKAASDGARTSQCFLMPRSLRAYFWQRELPKRVCCMGLSLALIRSFPVCRGPC